MPDFYNPNLLNPNASTTQQVPGLPGITKPFPVIDTGEPEYFVCTMLNHHMHRTDGKRLAFVFGVLKTSDHFDIEYMRNEIHTGNSFLRLATPQEINNYNMRMDPRGTMQKELTPAIEARVRTELEVELRQSMEERLSSLGIVLSDEQKQKLHEAEETKNSANDLGTGAGTSDESKLLGSDSLAALRNRLGAGVSTGTGTMFAGNTGGASILGGISGTDKTVNTAQEPEKRG